MPSSDPPPRRRRVWRWVRRGVVTAVAAFVALTLVCLVANALTTPPRTLAAPDGRDADVGGVRVHYREWGGGGVPVLLVHGFAESTVSWEPTATVLARSHHVVALDLAGNGYSQRTGRYGLDDQAELVAGLARALHLDHPVLVGHSMGAAVVGAVALRHPDEIGGVVFADGDGLPYSRDGGCGDQSSGGSDGAGGAQDGSGVPGWVLGSPWFVTGYRVATRWHWLDERIVRAQCGSVCRGVTPALVDAWLRPLRQGVTEHSLPAMTRAGVLHLTTGQVRAIRVPRGIVWGAEDATGGGSLAATRTNLGHPPEHVLAGAGHLSMVADPAGFAAAVDDLVARMPRQR